MRYDQKEKLTVLALGVTAVTLLGFAIWNLKIALAPLQ